MPKSRSWLDYQPADTAPPPPYWSAPGQWGKTGYSYGSGPAPGSEPDVQGLRNYVPPKSGRSLASAAAPTTSLAEVASRYSIPLPLAQALIHQESGGNAGAVSPAGATGITQVMPATAAGMYGITPEEAAVKLKDPSFAMDAGMRYLAAQYQTFGTWKLALAAYNAGPNAVREYHGVPPYAETQSYVRNILGRVGTLSAPASLGEPQGHGAQGLPSSAPAVNQVVRPPAFTFPKGQDAALAGLQRIAAGKSSNPVAELQALVSQTQHPEQAPPLEQPRIAPTPSTPQIHVEGKTVTSKVKSGIALVEQYLGTPYSWGGGGPSGPSLGIQQGAHTKGFDCSGLVQFYASKQGVSIPRTTFEQYKTGTAVSRSQLQAGDAVFFKGSDSQNGLPGHVALYIGGGRMIEAPHTGDVVKISKLAGRSDYVGARRY